MSACGAASSARYPPGAEGSEQGNGGGGAGMAARMALEAAVMEAEPPPYPMSGREQEGYAKVFVGHLASCSVFTRPFFVEKTHARGEALAQRAEPVRNAENGRNRVAELAIFTQGDHFFRPFFICFLWHLMMLPPP